MLYCDLDGVLVNMEDGVKRVTGCHIRTFDNNIGALWKQLAYTPNFFTNLDWMSDGKDLWKYIKVYNPTILTGIPWGNWAPKQKREWCKLHLGCNIPVITTLSKDKYTYCNTNDILIDDRRKARISWESAGGIFILHKNAKNTIQQLNSLLARGYL